ncbi:MAG: sigma-54-dependent Fis family transcriptional regulator [Halanaerobium sp.]|nr:sigma-54-dependent Fis family transcriptional regulator [Halanaerobium sp.]
MQVLFVGWNGLARELGELFRRSQEIEVRVLAPDGDSAGQIPFQQIEMTEVRGLEPDLVFNFTGGNNLGLDFLEGKILGEVVARDIVQILEEREELAQKLRQVNREKDVIINSTHDGMIAVNGRGVITLFNQAAEEITGMAREEVLGQLAEDVIPNTRLPVIIKSGKAELNRVQRLDDITIITNRVPVKDGEGRLVGAVAVFRDITEVRNLAEQITNCKEMRVMLEAIINSTQDAISVVDQHGKGILINPAYTRLTGMTEEDVIGKPATVDIAEGESMHMQVLETREAVSGVKMKVGPSKKEVIVNVAPILIDGQLKGSVGVIHDISEIKKLTEELDQARRMIRRLNAKYSFDDIVARSKTMLAVVEQAKRAAQTPATILLRGESGTGKELFAHAIHNCSSRRNGQFIRVNCPAIADSLLESELFGYEEGAFTGARKGGKKGLFAEANGGTIFLDEIGKVNLNLQAKLLRVLQEKEFTRVGGTKPIHVDVRIIVATNSNLERAVQEGTFREDLYYRLNVVPVFIPPLRKRKEDIPLLVHHLIRKFNQEYGRSVKACSREALDIIVDYDWPGNVRELENIIGRAMINVGFDSEVIQKKHLPPLGPLNREDELLISGPGVDDWEDLSLRQIMEETEREVILKALEAAEGNKTEAARKLGIAVRSLYYKLAKYGIDE